MLSGSASCSRNPMASSWVLPILLACFLGGCQTGRASNAVPADAMLTVGGIFWPELTPGFDTEAGTKPVLMIPAGSVCDIRVHPGAGPRRALVKVRVLEQWHMLWVEQLASPSFPEITVLPFMTFTYYTCGSDACPDRNWDQTRLRLVKAAEESGKEISEQYLRDLLGQKTFEAYHAKPYKGAH